MLFLNLNNLIFKSFWRRYCAMSGSLKKIFFFSWDFKIAQPLETLCVGTLSEWPTAGWKMKVSFSFKIEERN